MVMLLEVELMMLYFKYERGTFLYFCVTATYSHTLYSEVFYSGKLQEALCGTN
jgi:hypothetical protein